MGILYRGFDDINRQGCPQTRTRENRLLVKSAMTSYLLKSIELKTGVT